MITFTDADNGNYFISVLPKDNRNTSGLKQYLIDKGFIINRCDADEILIDIDSLINQLSLNQLSMIQVYQTVYQYFLHLRTTINKYCESTVRYFIVDSDAEQGRYTA